MRTSWLGCAHQVAVVDQAVSMVVVAQPAVLVLVEQPEAMTRTCIADLLLRVLLLLALE
jgi:hypothetical protein